MLVSYHVHFCLDGHRQSQELVREGRRAEQGHMLGVRDLVPGQILLHQAVGLSEELLQRNGVHVVYLFSEI